jgi:ArsR family transcriptional regulator, arsenate/arsenite/antimonite-responsive transcriptional repressor
MSLLDRVYRALGDPTRRQILRLLRARDMTAGEIADRFPLAKSTLSGHFAVLREAGLILAEKQSQRIVYSLNASAFEDALGATLELLRVGEERKDRVR